MPALKMKAKSTTTCKRERSYPHVSQNSIKISKLPCSMVKKTHEMENLAISSQTSHNGFTINEKCSEEQDNDKSQMSSNIDMIAEQTCLSFIGGSGSIVERDSLPFPLSSTSDTMLSYFNRPNDAHCSQFESVSKEQINWEPQVDDCNLPNFQMPDMLDSFMYEVCIGEIPSDEITVFDESRHYNTLSDLEFAGTTFIYDVPTLEETIAAAEYLGGSCEEFPQMSDSSWFHLMCHQAKPFTEELGVKSSQFESDGSDYSDPETFIKNFLALSDESNSLPALVSKETSKRKRVTLVLDLDETLVHSMMVPCDDADFTIQLFLDKEYTVYVRQRPFLREFLDKVSEMFEIIIFTASKRMYAEKLLDVLDPDKKFFSRRVYRESCIFQDGTYTKDLTVLGIDLAKVVIVDNSPQVFRLQVDNGIPIESWFDDPSDSALISLLPFLGKLADVDDVRPIIAEKFGAKN